MKLILKQLQKKDIDYERYGLIFCGLGFLAFQFFLKSIALRFTCPFKKLTGIPCLSCGMTRALADYSALDPLGAFFHNPLTALICFFMSVYLIYAIIALAFGTRRIRIDPDHRTLTRPGRILVLSLLAANWLYLIISGK